MDVLRVCKGGTVERIAGTQVAPPSLDPLTNVISKDILIIPETSVTSRLYRPNCTPETPQKLPLLLYYYHGGAFCISSATDPVYRNSLNNLVADANLIAVSVNYRLAPEHPLPAAYEDSWDMLRWVASHATDDREDHKRWLKNNVDFGSVFLGGDSAEANIIHCLALRLHASDPVATKYFKVCGLVMVNPYFWGKSRLEGRLLMHRGRKWWTSEVKLGPKSQEMADTCKKNAGPTIRS